MTNLQISRRTLFGGAALGMIGLALGTRPSVAAGSFEITRTPAEWRARLGPARYNILRQQGTERPYSSALLKEKRRGIYTCAGCDLPVYPSTAKYDSKTGWPSFWREMPGAVVYKRDTTLFMDRTEEICRRCGGHLGHRFDDGPPPTGKRHCINGLSLNFKPA